MTSTCPWNVPIAPANPPSVSGQNTRKPTMQEIIDEEFARQLFEEDCRMLAFAAAAEEEEGSNIFSDVEAKDTDRQLFSADSCSDSDYDEDKDDAPPRVPAAAGPAASASAKSKQRFDRSIPVEGTDQGLNSIRETFRRWGKQTRHDTSGSRVEASAFATQDAVLDTRTVRLLQKLINKGELDEVHGCVQSGKEASVYFALGTDPQTFRKREYALKIFKTTLSAFSNRNEYITGDRRYDLAFHKKDRRRQLQEWSDKEFRNLSRASKCIHAPVPYAIKEHIVVMQFIGNAADGLSAPTIKEVAAAMTTSQLVHAYADLLAATFTLFHTAKLVHSDLSEYNVLYHKQKCWLIDFGQAVDQTHPRFLDYLRRDLTNVHSFFAKHGLVEATTAAEDGLVGLLTVDEAFEWITGNESVLDAYPQLEAMIHSKY